MTADDDRKAIEAVVTDYLEGMIYGQTERIERAMHPLCMQAGHYRGNYEFFPRGDFIDSLKLEKMLEPGTPYRAAIVSVDMTGDVAVAKVTDDCFGTSFTDYLTLIRHEGRWQIVMKAFFDHAGEGRP
ncbi:nuclear transport factor 2 family protein [Aestuariivirga sp.]|uniref:nuclear transport factor 2 family protein n=1 Tax=Aestuariivirga sp. TaxID=2650926 RepID=UPI003918AB7D